RSVSRRRRLRRGLLRKPSVRPGLPRRGGSRPAAGTDTRVPVRHVGTRPDDRRAVRRGDWWSDGQGMLETLERGNLFVVPLDDERRWYRYHQLFADALRARLVAGDAERVGELHAAASRWLAEHGLLGDAVRHAIASADYEHTADLIELSVADVRRRRQDRTLREWLVALPDEVVRRRPLLAMYMGWSRLSEGDFDGVEAWLDAAEAGLDTTLALTFPTAGSLAEAARDRESEVRSLPAM